MHGMIRAFSAPVAPGCAWQIGARGRTETAGGPVYRVKVMRYVLPAPSSLVLRASCAIFAALPVAQSGAAWRGAVACLGGVA